MDSDILKTIALMVDTNIYGYNRKEIACMLRPRMSVESAKTWLTQCLQDSGGYDFKPKDIERLCEITGRAELYINHLCDNNGFSRPARRLVMTPERELEIIKQYLEENSIEIDIEEYIQSHSRLLNINRLQQRKTNGRNR